MKLNIILTTLVSSIALTHAAPTFQVHEWGTFTTIAGSDGRLLSGLEQAEEALPYFVHHFPGVISGKGLKAIPVPVENVLVKMETPVVYFYSKESFSADVEVKFPHGSINEWYPQRSGGEAGPPIPRLESLQPPNPTPLKPIDFAKPYGGSIQWKVSVEPAGEDAMSRVFVGAESPVWLYPRQTDAALVTAQGETEKYLFYRGVGNFIPQLTTRQEIPGTLTLENTGKEPIGNLLVFHFPEGGNPCFLVSPGLAPGQTATVPLPVQESQRVSQKALFNAMAKILTNAGLYRKEADAMIQTWWNSYFNQLGTRLFWVTPPQALESILPLTVKPAPQEQVRVIVARSEVLTLEKEQSLLTLSQDAEKWQQLGQDRYFLAYQQRVKKLASPKTANR